MPLIRPQKQSRGRTARHGKPSKPPRDPFADIRKKMLSRDDAAENTRLHRDYWGGASDTSINTLLQRNLATWRARSRYEAVNNPIVKGMIETYCQDVVGPNGPKLDIRTEDKNFNAAVESLWDSWWKSPDINGQLAGADFLNLASNQLWTHGSYLWQFVTDKDAPRDGIQTRIKAIDARRLNGSMMSFRLNDIILGIRVSPSGKPLSYFIEQPDFANLSAMAEPIEVDAKFIIHGFDRLEPEQLTGVPLLKHVLEICADRRQLNRYIIEGYKFAAAVSAFIQAKDNTTTPQAFTDSYELEPGVLASLPPGYGIGTTPATQPSAQFDVFEKSLLAQMGRPVGMPHGKVALDYSNLSFSAARLMDNTYHGGLATRRASIGRVGLNRLLFAVLAEAELKGLIALPTEPLKWQWTWPAHASTDPKSDAAAATERLVNLTSTPEYEAAAAGLDFEDTVKSHERCKEALEKIGIAYPITRQGVTPEAQQEPDPEDEPKPVKRASSNGNGNGNGHGHLVGGRFS